MKRDLSEAQFRARLAKLGGTYEGFMGYCRFTLPDGASVSISRLNAGTVRRRDQLRYLAKALKENIARDAKRALEAPTRAPAAPSTAVRVTEGDVDGGAS